jgi:hypothetical protein
MASGVESGVLPQPNDPCARFTTTPRWPQRAQSKHPEMALGVTAPLERQMSRRHRIFGLAIGTFEDDHRFTTRLRLMM